MLTWLLQGLSLVKKCFNFNLDDEIVEENAAVKLDADYLINYFKHNLDNIHKAEKLNELDSNEIPIIEHHGDVRLEQITPSAKKDVIIYKD